LTRYKMLVLSRPAEGCEDEYNDWYQNTHLEQIVSLPGFVAAERYELAVNMLGEGAYPYIAIYEIETDDVQSAFAALQEAAGDGSIVMSPAFDTASVYASIYAPLGERISRS
jgi:hypothetical protein